MTKMLDLAGMEFNGWSVIRPAPEARKAQTNRTYQVWLCRCRGCGVEKPVWRCNLVSGASRACRKCVKKLGYWKQPRRDVRAEKLQQGDKYFVDAVRGLLDLEPLYIGGSKSRRTAERRVASAAKAAPLSPKDDSWWEGSD